MDPDLGAAHHGRQEPHAVRSVIEDMGDSRDTGYFVNFIAQDQREQQETVGDGGAEAALAPRALRIGVQVGKSTPAATLRLPMRTTLPVRSGQSRDDRCGAECRLSDAIAAVCALGSTQTWPRVSSACTRSCSRSCSTGIPRVLTLQVHVRVQVRGKAQAPQAA